MTDPRLTWLLAQIEADQATAKAAGMATIYTDRATKPREEFKPGWITETGRNVGLVRVAGEEFLGSDVFVDSEIPDGMNFRPEDCRHAATWDPARALAVVAALRRILSEHGPSSGSTPICLECDFDSIGCWPCPTVKAIAGIYADRPGFEEVWDDE